MRLRFKELCFDQITYHAKVTQCLGSFENQSWFLALAQPTWSVDIYPKPWEIEIFEIPGIMYRKIACEKADIDKRS